MQKNYKKPLLLTLTSIAIFFSIFGLVMLNTPEIGENEEEEKDGMDKAWEQEFEMTKDPALGYVPSERLLAAWYYTKGMNLSRGSQAISNIEWRALGPKNYGGRTRALLVDLNDATRRTVFAGSVGGGLWKTTDITATEPNWTPINDLFGNLAISSLAQDPTNPLVIYFGTGEGYGNNDAIRGLGVWKSVDGGNTWNQLSSTNNSNFYYNYKVFVSNNGTLYSCTNNGLFRSINGGTSFTKVLGTGLGIPGTNSNTCYDIEQAANGDIYATLRGVEGSGLSGSIHKSINGGTSWSAALPLPISADRIEIATAPSNANYIYALVELGSQVEGILLSTNGGTSFTSKTEPVDADGGIPSYDFSRGQAWYDLTIAVAPTDENTVFVGGVDLFKSSNSGNNWTQVAHWYGGFGFQDVHADQHGIFFSPGSGQTVYFVNDGAIYRSDNALASIPVITSKETNYNTLQFYGCAMDPTAGSYNFLAGAQDNGTHRFTQSLLGNTTEATGGDGAFCHIDQNEPQYWFSSYVYNSYYRSTNGGVSFPGSATYGSSTGRFINPTDYDDINNKMYCALSSDASSSTYTYLRWENPQTGNTFTPVTLSALGGHVASVKVSPNVSNRVYFGTHNGKVVKVDNANTNSPSATTINVGAGMPVSYISCVEVQQGDDNHILVTFSNYGVNSIWETTNGGANWQSVEGNIPDMPVRWVIFNPANNDQALIATELGVWSTDDLNGTSTNWGTSNNGLANVRVDMLQTRSSDKMIIAATHGRGLYYTGSFSPPSASFYTDANIIYPGRELQFTNTSLNATSYAWDFGDGTNSTVQDPLKKFNTPGTYTVSLTINGGASTVTQQIIVMPFSGTPYNLSDGGNFELNTNHFAAETISGTGWQRGNSSVTGKNGVNSGANAWVTGLTNANYVDNSESYLYTPSYNLAAAGTYTLSFFTKYVFENDWDGFRVEYSLDKGVNWNPVGTTVTTNWYNSPNTSGTTAFPANQAFFSGTQSTYSQKSFNISFLTGNNQVAFRFAFISDGGVTAAGAAIDDITISGAANNPLPLNLLRFTGTKENKDALLQWTTADEKNVDYFDLERSWNGKEFSAITRRTAQNRSQNNYSFKDLLSKLSSRISNTVYYRLKMVDKNGSFNYSNVVEMKWDDMKNALVSITPNPFTSYIQINTTMAIKQVQVLDNSGKVILSTSNIPNGRLNLQSLPAGSYYLRVYTSNDVITKKILKQ